MSEFFKDYKQLLLTSKILKKDKTNPFYNSKYVELKDVLDYAKELCTQHNFIFIQYPDIKDGIKVLKTELRHESGECITASAPIVDGNDYQKVSGSITHMRRYNLTSILGLEEEDDDANGAVEKKQTTKTATTPTTTSKIAKPRKYFSTSPITL